MVKKGSEKKEDLRIKRTRKLLLDSLLFLIEEKAFENITVTDICEKAMVHRTTFYKHFNDKYHLLEFGIIDLMKNFDKAINFDKKISTSKQYSMGLIKHAAEYLSTNKKRSLSVMVRSESSSIMTTLHNLIVNEIMGILKENEKKGFIYHVPMPIIAEFHAGALISLAKWWIENKMSVPQDKIVKYVDLMINDDQYVSIPKT